MQVEAEHSWRRIRIDIELFYVNCMYGIKVAVWRVSSRRVGAKIGALAGVIAQADDTVNA